MDRRTAGAALVIMLLAWVAFASHASAGAAGARDANGTAPQTNARVGFYQWVSVTPPGVRRDLLTLARQRIKAAGAGLMRFYVGARFDYIHPLLDPGRFPGLARRTPADIIDLPYYRAVFEDPAIQTIILTAYPSMDYGAGPDDIHLTRPWTAREEREEYSQIRALCERLFEEYGAQGKTVIIANAEADDKMLEIMNYSGEADLAVENLRSWQNARYRGLDSARRAHPRARLRLLSAFEISLVNMRIIEYQGRFVKHPKGRWNALADVVPHIPFDLLSYSSYESTNAPFDTANIDTPPPDTGARLLRDIAIIRHAVSKPIMIGELGIPYDRFEKLSSGGVAPRLAAALDAIQKAKPEYVVFWQVFDAPAEGREPSGFGWLDPRRSPAPPLLPFIARYGRALHAGRMD